MPNAIAAKPASPAQLIRQSLEQSKGQIERALPRHLSADRIIRQTMTVVQESDFLLKCNPLSILKGVIKGSELGLEFGAALGQAWLVPFKDQAALIIGYRGLIALAMRSQTVRSIQPRVVYKADSFHVEYGTNARIDHTPDLEAQETPGEEPTHYYVVVEFTNGGRDFEVMTRWQVEKHRDRFSKGKDRHDSPWKTNFDQMALKTVIRRIAKRLPASVELAEAAAMDEAAERGEAIVGTAEVELKETPTTKLANLLSEKATNGAKAEPPKDEDRPKFDEGWQPGPPEQEAVGAAKQGTIPF